MDGLVERFCRYVKVDTQADETSSTAPSTAKQLDLSRMLADECRELGLQDVTLTVVRRNRRRLNRRRWRRSFLASLAGPR